MPSLHTAEEQSGGIANEVPAAQPCGSHTGATGPAAACVSMFGSAFGAMGLAAVVEERRRRKRARAGE